MKIVHKIVSICPDGPRVDGAISLITIPPLAWFKGAASGLCLTPQPGSSSRRERSENNNSKSKGKKMKRARIGTADCPFTGGPEPERSRELRPGAGRVGARIVKSLVGLGLALAAAAPSGVLADITLYP